MKKILFLIETDSMTGSGKCALELIQQYHTSKICNLIVLSQHSNDINAYCNKNSIENYAIHFPLTRCKGGKKLGRLIAITARPFLNVFSYLRLKRKIDFSSIDIIHSNTSAIDFGAYLYKKTGIPHIWHFREFSAFNGSFNMIVGNYISYVNLFSTKIITVSKDLANFLISKGIPAQKVTPVYDGIPQINKISAQTEDFNDNLKIVCVGHIYKQKGQDSIIKALCLLPNEIKTKIRCDFIGPWEKNFKKDLESLIISLGLNDIVTFLGPATNVPDVLTNYHIGIQPSHAEGLSRVAVEYMQAGLCIIATKEAASPELVQDGINGLFYTDYDYRELANLIERCFYNRNLIKQLGHQARIDAIKNFCIENNFTKIIDVYEEICSSKNTVSTK